MATSRTRKKKKVDDTPEVTAEAPITTEETPPPTDPAPAAEPEPEPPPPPPPAKKATKDKKPAAAPTEWVVKVDGKVVGEKYPSKMAAIRAGIGIEGATVEPA